MKTTMKNLESRDDELPSIPKIDRVIHEPARLAIMAYLFMVDIFSYNAKQD
jgi:hypothetical protein